MVVHNTHQLSYRNQKRIKPLALFRTAAPATGDLDFISRIFQGLCRLTYPTIWSGGATHYLIFHAIQLAFVLLHVYIETLASYHRIDLTPVLQASTS